MVPRPAATVVLLRPGVTGLETFLLRRAGTMAFAAGAHVFPGGRVDLADQDELPWAQPPDEEFLARRLNAPAPLGRSLLVAAIRETFEEAGVLLAWAPSGHLRPGPAWEALRAGLVARTVGFADVLAALDARLAPEQVIPWDHWITPEHEPLRYDTRFFVAELPFGQLADAVSEESEAAAWVAPAAALAAHERDELAMLPPTVATLRSLCDHATPGSVLRAAEARVIRPILPRARFDQPEPAWELFDALTGDLL